MSGLTQQPFNFGYFETANKPEWRKKSALSWIVGVVEVQNHHSERGRILAE